MCSSDLEKFKAETGVAYGEFEIAQEAQREQAIRNFADQGYSPIIAAGFAQAAAVEKVAKEYPDVELDEKIVDAMAALLVRHPDRFDCIVTGNRFGDILSDEASEISGGLGLAASTMAGDDACCAQAQHGSAPDIAGMDKANPTSLILSAAMLLDWLSIRHKRAEFDAAEIGRAHV